MKNNAEQRRLIRHTDETSAMLNEVWSLAALGKSTDEIIALLDKKLFPDPDPAVIENMIDSYILKYEQFMHSSVAGFYPFVFVDTMTVSLSASAADAHDLSDFPEIGPLFERVSRAHNHGNGNAAEKPVFSGLVQTAADDCISSFSSPLSLFEYDESDEGCVHEPCPDGGTCTHPGHLRQAAFVIGLNCMGYKEILDVALVDPAECHLDASSALNFWKARFARLKSRGLEDLVFIVGPHCGAISEAMRAVWPDAHYQKSVMHLIRMCMARMKSRVWRPFTASLKSVYTADSQVYSRRALEELKSSWQEEAPEATEFITSTYDSSIAPMYDFGKQVRRLIYTTNSLESFYNSMRRITRGMTFADELSATATLMLRLDFQISPQWLKKSSPHWNSVQCELFANKRSSKIMYRTSQWQNRSTPRCAI